MTEIPGEPEDAYDWFWGIIQQAQRDTGRLHSILSALDKSEVYEFQDVFIDRAVELQDEPFIDHLDDVLTEDGVADVSHVVVSRGREYYDAVVADPSRIPARVEADDPDDLFAVAYIVYRERFGELLDLN